MLSLTPLFRWALKAAKTQKGAAANVIFKTYSNGVMTSRDAWVYNFQ